MEAYPRSYRVLVAALAVSGLAVAWLAGCGGNSGGGNAEGHSGGQGGTLTVFAASSLTDAFGVSAGAPC